VIGDCAGSSLMRNVTPIRGGLHDATSRDSTSVDLRGPTRGRERRCPPFVRGNEYIANPSLAQICLRMIPLSEFRRPNAELLTAQRSAAKRESSLGCIRGAGTSELDNRKGGREREREGEREREREGGRARERGREATSERELTRIHVNSIDCVDVRVCFAVCMYLYVMMM